MPKRWNSIPRGAPRSGYDRTAAAVLTRIQKTFRRTVIRRFARLGPDDRFMICKPPKGGPHARGQHKVIFDTEQRAMDCIAALAELSGARPMVAYDCPRPGGIHHHGRHYHIATDRELLHGDH